jgi:hypothetical protein
MACVLPDQSDQEAQGELTTQIVIRIAELDLIAEFEAAGSPYSELGADGRIVTHNPTRPDAQSGTTA